MKASDLMIGDWISCGGRNLRINEIGGMFCLDAVDDLFAALEDVEPIPLTPEILERNGFWFGYTTNEEDFCGSTGAGYPEKGWCWDEGAGTIKIIFPTEADGGLVVLDDGNFDREMSFVFVKTVYVHELQHALKLCGIDKEIVL
jgi:hypothetical protein